MGRRWRAGTVTIVLGAIVVASPGTASSRSSNEVPVDSWVQTPVASASGARSVWIWAQRQTDVVTGLQPTGDVCAGMTTIRNGIRIEEFGCARVSYTFDPVTWDAWAEGVLSTEVTGSKRRNGQWVPVELHAPGGQARVRVRWTGAGEPTPEAQYWVGLCFFLVPCGWGTVHMVNDAVVSGSIDFRGLGVRVRLPQGHPGEMRYWAP